MTFVLIAMCFLFASRWGETEATTGCDIFDFFAVTQCYTNEEIIFSITDYINLYQSVCPKKSEFLACTQVLVDKCKSGIAADFLSGFISQLNIDNMEASLNIGCSDFGDVETQTDCIDNNNAAMVTCITLLQTELGQNILTLNPSVNQVTEAMCSLSTGLESCVQNHLGSCGNFAAKLTEFVKISRPETPCSTIAT